MKTIVLVVCFLCASPVYAQCSGSACRVKERVKEVKVVKKVREVKPVRRIARWPLRLVHRCK